MMITEKDFTVETNDSESDDLWEERLTEALRQGGSQMMLYKLNVDKDGTDKILL